MANLMGRSAGLVRRRLKRTSNAVKAFAIASKRLNEVRTAPPNLHVTQDAPFKRELSWIDDHTYKVTMANLGLFNPQSKEHLLDSFRHVSQAVARSNSVKNDSQRNYSIRDLLSEATKYGFQREELGKGLAALHHAFVKIGNLPNKQEKLDELYAISTRQYPAFVRDRGGSAHPILSSATPISQKIGMGPSLIGHTGKRKPASYEEKIGRDFKQSLEIHNEEGKLRTEMLAGVHLTDYLPFNGIIRPTGDSRPEAPRRTIHFALNGTVSPVNSGISDWSGKKVSVIVPIEKIRGWIANLHSVDTFGYGRLRLPPGSRVLVEKELADRNGLTEGQKLGHAEVVVVDPNADKYSHDYSPALHQETYAQLRKMGYPTARIGDRQWVMSIEQRDSELLRKAMTYRPLTNSNVEVPGVTYGLHVSERHGRYTETEPAVMNAFLKDLKKGNSAGVEIEKRHLLMEPRYYDNGTEEYIVETLKRAQNLSSDDFAKQIEEKQEALREGIANKKINQRDARRLRQEIGAMNKMHEIAIEIEENRLKKLGELSR